MLRNKGLGFWVKKPILAAALQWHGDLSLGVSNLFGIRILDQMFPRVIGLLGLMESPGVSSYLHNHEDHCYNIWRTHPFKTNIYPKFSFYKEL